MIDHITAEKEKDMREKEPIYYARAAIETMMRKYEAAKLPPEGHFHYHQGVFLSGVYQIYKLCQDERYFQYIKDWVDSCVNKEGEIESRDPGQLDDIQPGILLFPLLDATGDERYKKAMDILISAVRTFPRNEEGGFWHKKRYPNQMWLDGLYMAGPFATEYGKRFQRMDDLENAISQALLMEEKTRDERTGLWYHAWDCSRKAEWAEARTGLSPEFWGRSIGWVPVALLEELNFIPKKHPGHQKLRRLIRELLEAICRYQSEDGRWYQVVDKGGMAGNWLETSCSCLYVAAIYRAIELEILPGKYLIKAQNGYKGVIQSLQWKEEDLLIGGICIGTGVGNYRHYCERPASVNDLHGVGAFLLMCAAAQRSSVLYNAADVAGHRSVDCR